MRTDMVTAYVRQLLEDMTGARPEPDEDGDLPIRHRGSCFYLRVLVPEDPYVQVFSIAVAEVAESPELLHELNTINASLHFARAFHVSGQVLFETEIWGTDLNPGNVAHACRNVARATDRHGLDLATRFGGRALFHEQQTAAPVAAGEGMYL